MDTSLTLTLTRPALSALSVPAPLPAAVELPARVAANVGLAPVARALLAPQPPARLLDPRDLSKLLRGLVQGAANNLGHRSTATDPLDVLALSVTTAEMIRRDFSALKAGEIEQAFLRGGSGAYRVEGELELVSAPTFRRWLDAYQTGARWEAGRALEAAEPLKGQSSPLPDNHPVIIAWRVDYVAQIVAAPDCLTAPALSGGIGRAMVKMVWEWLNDQWGAFAGFRTAAEYEAIRADAVEEMLRHPRPHDREGRARFTEFVESLAEDRAIPAGNPYPDEVRYACRVRCLQAWCADHTEMAPAALRAMLSEYAERHYPPFTPFLNF